ncbi:MAG: ArdC family protein [Ruminococcus sp.]|nr:ArdC-like ssDNA-binding domain-containing protein [Ruminococcus sp.]MCI5617701.1 ArdC family protein [Ruminococcus sp.]
MTNNAIIEKAKNQLLAEGKIGSSTVTTEYGEVEVPEEIHTYAMWKSLGYQVKKGEKAIAKFSIWKYVSKKSKEKEDEEEAENSRMFLKASSFFKFSQVEKVG